eukprot:TRINITY_DN11483_c0_g1_i1.p1 TRINITY_DN11483_c0_g1~~TRINITY_DN11483_c0_g1_i1.p1  ORF type:complete len:503 (-),score=80.87 TRINITY_DN11483_c0_g1_i1:266-1774(-)
MAPLDAAPMAAAASQGPPPSAVNVCDAVAPARSSSGLLAAPASASSDQYSALVGSAFMLNMVLGTGPLTLPYAFEEAGIVLSSVFVGVLMILSYMSATFVVEALSRAGKVRRSPAAKEPAQRQARELELEEQLSPSAAGMADDESEISERLELGAIAEAVMPPGLSKVPYVVLIVYAYGVLSVYVISGVSSIASLIGDVHGVDSYYLLLAGFICVVSPLCLMDFSKTRPLQVCIAIVRIVVVILMMMVMVRYMADGVTKMERSQKWREMPLWNIGGLPTLFGNAAFTFMIHHSIPGVVYPMKKHTQANKAIGWTYAVAYVMYIVLCLFALWSFGDIQYKSCHNQPSHPCKVQPLFNLNFASADFQWAAKFIVGYPCLVISVFPLVAITLRNNLKALCGVKDDRASGGRDWRNLGFTLAAVVPPFTVALFTRDVQVVMTYVGGYFGLMLMFLVPALLVRYARRAWSGPCALRSPFDGRLSLSVILVAFVGAIVFNTVKLVGPH